ncbi:DMT family transporter [Alteromonas sp. AMM-1]|uniref:DMT family transporter n=1 Tax=Alteromonas sp. AMM-1 TaxID=3394233 RepID=UPI0039A4CFF3
MTGELAAITTALCWAIAARLFRLLGRSFSPLAMNFWKGFIAIVVLSAITHFLLPSVSLTWSVWGWLLLSGAIGIGLGDTFFFQALNKIGDAQTMLVAETLAPIFTALLAMAWIGEWLSWQQWLGIAIVILSVDMIVKLQKRATLALFSVSGYVLAALAALCQAVGAVISRDMLVSVELDAFHASQIRLFGGIAIITVLMLVFKQRWLPNTPNRLRTWMVFGLTALVGTVLAIYLQMVAFSATKAAVVQTLFASSVVLSLGIAWATGERVGRPTFIWSLVALTGVAILVWLA